MMNLCILEKVMCMKMSSFKILLLIIGVVFAVVFERVTRPTDLYAYTPPPRPLKFPQYIFDMYDLAPATFLDTFHHIACRYNCSRQWDANATCSWTCQRFE